jgi:hypothetical protein
MLILQDNMTQLLTLWLSKGHQSLAEWFDSLIIICIEATLI